MKKNILYPCLHLFLAVSLIWGGMAAPSSAAQSAPNRAAGQTSRNVEKPKRLGMIVGGPTSEYQLIFTGMIERLAELGLIADDAVVAPEGQGLKPMWKWLSANAGGDKLSFVADAFYSPDWDEQDRPRVKDALLRRLKTKNDLDCILAFGTWGGQDIAKEDLDVPVLVISVTNAVEAEIIPSVDDSGRDNLLAIIEPDRYLRQVNVFHEIIGFSKLGIVYEDTPAGRSSISLTEIEEAAAEKGITLERCNDNFYIEDVRLAAERLRACHAAMVDRGAEAVYITYNLALEGEYTSLAMEPLLKAGLPTFAQSGSDLVRQGAMLSVARSNIKDEGIFAADSLEKILRGQKPRAISQRYDSVFSLAVNLRTAALAGWNPPMDILAVVDEFYQD